MITSSGWNDSDHKVAVTSFKNLEDHTILIRINHGKATTYFKFDPVLFDSNKIEQALNAKVIESVGLNCDKCALVLGTEYFPEEPVPDYRDFFVSKPISPWDWQPYQTPKFDYAIAADAIPGIQQRVKCPCGKKDIIDRDDYFYYHVKHHDTAPLMDVIFHLNDTVGWTREAIADWLDTLDNPPGWGPTEGDSHDSND